MSAYHIPFREAVRLTVPQIIMLNHAAWCESQTAELRAQARVEKDEADPIVHDFHGMRMSEIAQDEKNMSRYFADWSGFA